MRDAEFEERDRAVSGAATEVMLLAPGVSRMTIPCGCVMEQIECGMSMKMCPMHLHSEEVMEEMRSITHMAVIMSTAQLVKSGVGDERMSKENFVRVLMRKGLKGREIKKIIKGEVNWMTVWQKLIKVLSKADPVTTKLVTDASKDAMEMWMADIERESGEEVPPEIKEEARRDGPAALRKDLGLAERDDEKSCDCLQCRMLRGETAAPEDDEK